MTTRFPRFLRSLRGLAAPALLWALFLGVVWQVVPSWLRGDAEYDEQALREWIDEARGAREPLPEMVRDFVDEVEQARRADPGAGAAAALLNPLEQPEPPERTALNLRLYGRFAKIEEHLRTLGTPTKLQGGLLPLFPTIYRLEVRFDDALGLPPAVWDSDLPRHPSQYQELSRPHPLHARAALHIQFQLHAWNKRQRLEQAAATRLRWVGGLGIAGTVLALSWMYLVQRGEAERERQRVEGQRQIAAAERIALEQEIGRREAERRHEETERKLLEQRLATQAAEGQALELRSQIYAGIGIMAGSYAHNIKNLLVRPNDLLRRCLEGDGLSADREQMLHEVRHTLGTVTERLQQILRTVRRDPTRAEPTRLDLNAVLRDIEHTWKELARERWKLELTVEPAAEPLWVEGDVSHLQQAVENLLFNARDATFERRNRLRDDARAAAVDPTKKKQALIAAAAWRGRAVLKTWRSGDTAILEVSDNGVGMTDEVRRRCTETHFSTKRDNALHEGNSTGMGLGLSFVVAILENHRATLTIESEPGRGATFRATFPALASC